MSDASLANMTIDHRSNAAPASLHVMPTKRRVVVTRAHTRQHHSSIVQGDMSRGKMCMCRRAGTYHIPHCARTMSTVNSFLRQMRADLDVAHKACRDWHNEQAQHGKKHTTRQAETERFIKNKALVDAAILQEDRPLSEKQKQNLLDEWNTVLRKPWAVTPATMRASISAVLAGE